MIRRIIFLAVSGEIVALFIGFTVFLYVFESRGALPSIAINSLVYALVVLVGSLLLWCGWRFPSLCLSEGHISLIWFAAILGPMVGSLFISNESNFATIPDFSDHGALFAIPVFLCGIVELIGLCLFCTRLRSRSLDLSKRVNWLVWVAALGLIVSSLFMFNVNSLGIISGFFIYDVGALNNIPGFFKQEILIAISGLISSVVVLIGLCFFYDRLHVSSLGVSKRVKLLILIAVLALIVVSLSSIYNATNLGGILSATPGLICGIGAILGLLPFYTTSFSLCLSKRWVVLVMMAVVVITWLLIAYEIAGLTAATAHFHENGYSFFNGYPFGILQRSFSVDKAYGHAWTSGSWYNFMQRYPELVYWRISPLGLVIDSFFAAHASIIVIFIFRSLLCLFIHPKAVLKS